MYPRRLPSICAFSSGDKTIGVYGEPASLADRLRVPYATRAAFRWTQLPEQRDLRTDEPVGGNITLPPLAGPFTLVMHFDIGRQRDDKRELRFPQLHCVGRN